MSAAQQLQLPDLTIPLRDTSTLRRVLTQYWQRVLQEFLRLPQAKIKLENRPLYVETARLLEQLARADLRTALQIVRQPTISTLVQIILPQLQADGDQAALNRWLREACVLVLLELAVRGGLPAEGVQVGRGKDGSFAVLRCPDAQLQVELLPAATTVLFLPKQLRIGPGDWQVALDDPTSVAANDAPFSLTHPYHEIVAGLFLAETDNNPLSDFEAHPDKSGNQLNLGGHSVQQWVDELRADLLLIDKHLPLVGQEIRLTMKLIIPVGYDAEKHLSASYEEAIGLLYMTLHPNRMTMTEALIHEFQHNKINAAFRIDPLLSNAWRPLYTSPVRPDPRPLHGVVLAVHAFQPVAKLYEIMTENGDDLSRNAYFKQRFHQILQINRRGATTVLDHAKPTAVGGPFFAEMRAIEDHFAVYAQQNWPDES